MTVKLVIALIYLGVVFYLGYVGWKHTREAADYMLAGRRMNPFIMAMSYGATFISTSAIVGFGGVASLFGFPLLWLTFANIFVGIFIAMVFFGRR
ncbi:MAG: sodium:solute symporter family protein, partial [Desulfocurvibacter africanus]